MTVNAFDQYVPGFGITFLLIGMMLGLALTLFDERDWGTLKRLQVSGAPLTGLLLGNYSRGSSSGSRKWCCYSRSDGRCSESRLGAIL